MSDEKGEGGGGEDGMRWNCSDLEGSASHLPDKTTIDKAKLDRLKYLFQVRLYHNSRYDKTITGGANRYDPF